MIQKWFVLDILASKIKLVVDSGHQPDDVLGTLAANNSRITMEEVASELKVTKSTAFPLLQKGWVHFEDRYMGAASVE